MRLRVSLICIRIFIIIYINTRIYTASLHLDMLSGQLYVFFRHGRSHRPGMSSVPPHMGACVRIIRTWEWVVQFTRCTPGGLTPFDSLTPSAERSAILRGFKRFQLHVSAKRCANQDSRCTIPNRYRSSVGPSAVSRVLRSPVSIHLAQTTVKNVPIKKPSH